MSGNKRHRNHGIPYRGYNPVGENKPHTIMRVSTMVSERLKGLRSAGEGY